MEKKHFRKKVSQCRKTKSGNPLGFFNIHSVAKHQKIEVEKKFYFREKNLTVPKKMKGDLLGFSNISILTQNIKKIEGGTPLGKKNFRKKVSQCRKKIERGDALVSPTMVCYAGKQEKPFWFSSLDQIVQFGAITFCRTCKNYFGQFVRIEKKRKATIIVAFHFIKRRLKTQPERVRYLEKTQTYLFQNVHISFAVSEGPLCFD